MTHADNVKEGKPYTIGEFALYSGLSVDEIWTRLEQGELSAVIYADGDQMHKPDWRAVPSEAVPLMRAGTSDLIEWESLIGRVVARCDPDAVRVLPLEPDMDALRRPRRRVTGLRAAVEAAWWAGLPVNAIVSGVMDFLGRHDKSGYIVRIDSGVITWRNDKNEEQETKKKSLANQLVGWRKEFRSASAAPANTK